MLIKKMVAVSLHRAIFSPEPVPSHSRDISTISDSTFNTNVLETSHQTEPLLSSGPQPRQLNYDISYPHISVHDEESVSAPPRLANNLINGRGKRESSQNSTRIRLKRLRISKIILEILLGESPVNILANINLHDVFWLIQICRNVGYF